MQSQSNTAEHPLFGAAVYTYTRAQAIADGVLVDVANMAQEAGFRIPVAMSIAAWTDCVAWSDEDSKRQVYQDESGRLWDVLYVASLAARRARGSALNTVNFELYRVPCCGHAVQPRKTALKLHVGPGDAGEPVITIMLPNED